MNKLKQITRLHNTLQYLHLLPKDQQINEINQLIRFAQLSQSIPVGFVNSSKSLINHLKYMKNEINKRYL